MYDPRPVLGLKRALGLYVVFRVQGATLAKMRPFCGSLLWVGLKGPGGTIMYNPSKNAALLGQYAVGGG